MIVGGALAVGNTFNVLAWLDIVVVALLMQMATNAMNEYGDYRRAIDTAPSVGFAGIIVRGEVPASEVLFTAVGCYAVAFALGVLLVLLRGPLLLILGIAAILAGILYSEGPFPVSSTPFGELLVGMIMGPIEVVSANIAASGSVSGLALPYSAPVALLVIAILLANNLRDVEKDRQHGRRTIAVLVGRARGSYLLLSILLAAFLWSFPAYFLLSAPPAIFLIWLVLPVALKGYRDLTRRGLWGAAVPIVARVHILVGLLLAVSLIVRV